MFDDLVVMVKGADKFLFDFSTANASSGWGWLVAHAINLSSNPTTGNDKGWLIVGITVVIYFSISNSNQIRTFSSRRSFFSPSFHFWTNNESGGPIYALHACSRNRNSNPTHVP